MCMWWRQVRTNFQCPKNSDLSRNLQLGDEVYFLIIGYSFPFPFVSSPAPLIVAGTVVVQVTKLNRGEDFPSLDMLTTLLPRRQRRDLRKVGEKPMIEVLESGSVDKEEMGGARVREEEGSGVARATEEGKGRGGASDGRTKEEEERRGENREEEDWDWEEDQNFSNEAEVR